MVRRKRMKKENGVAVADPMVEVGVTGLSRFGGVIGEEWLSQLKSLSASNKVYREMRDNDATIGAVFFSIDMLLSLIHI